MKNIVNIIETDTASCFLRNNSENCTPPPSLKTVHRSFLVSTFLLKCEINPPKTDLKPEGQRQPSDGKYENKGHID